MEPAPPFVLLFQVCGLIPGCPGGFALPPRCMFLAVSLIFFLSCDFLLVLGGGCESRLQYRCKPRCELLTTLVTLSCLSSVQLQQRR